MNVMSILYEQTEKFNTISGAINETTEQAFTEQFEYISEEFFELKQALVDNDLSEVLDGCVDVIITAFGMLQKLESLGVNVQDAATATGENNLSKYTPSPAIAHQTVEKLLIEKGIRAEAKFNEEHNCYVIRNKTSGKVCKPLDFVSNALSVFITDEVKENYDAR